MDKLVTVVLGAIGGLIGASTLGVLEALFHLVTAGAPDLLAPLYAVLLYGLLGLPFGIAGGIATLVGARFFSRRAADSEADAEGAEPTAGWQRHIAMATGSAFAVAPLLLFILFYLGNKVVYAEQGVPTSGKLTILAIVGVTALVQIGGGAFASRKAGLKAVYVLGAWAGLVLLTGALSAIPTGDPRSNMAHGKPVPGGMADNPNVLVIAVDTLRADYLGTYGMEGDPTPVLDAIAADGIVFEDASAHASWTRSSFASLWSSRIPSSHNADTKASRLSDDVVLISEALQDAGVTTGNLANNINVTATFNFDQGYDTFLYEAPDYHFGATESVFSLTFYKVVHKLREKLGGSKEVGTFYQPAEVVLEDAQTFIQANRDARWMLGVHLMEPHDPYFEHPYLTGEGDAEFNGVGFARAEVEHPSMDQVDYLKKVYLDEIRHMDLKLKPFVEWLKAEGLYDDLMIVITADHGEEFGEHGGFWHGTTLYEEQIHVPLIVKLPKNHLKGERVKWQARLVDVAPTIATALGVAIEEDWKWMGEDLVAAVELDVEARETVAKKVDDARRLIDELAEQRDAGFLAQEQLDELAEAEELLEEQAAEPDPCDQYSVIGDRTVYAEQDFEGNVISALKKDGFKLITANEGNPRGLEPIELYDLENDRLETSNLQGVKSPICGESPAERIEAMQQKLSEDLETAAAGAPIVEEVEVDEAETCRLCALGYLSGPMCDAC
jgi:arylsulfatase A-like enzyme